MSLKNILCGAISAVSLISFADTPEKNVTLGANNPDKMRLVPITASMSTHSTILFNVLAGEIAIQRGQFAAAEQYYFIAGQLAKNVDLAKLATGTAVAAQNYPVAAKDLEYWLKLNPKQLEALQMGALIAIENGDEKSAVDYLRRLITLKAATSDDGYAELTALLERVNKMELRLQLARKVITNDKLEDPNAIFALANAEFEANNWKEAEKLIRKALAKHPGWYEAQLLLVRTLKADNNVQAARTFLEQLVKNTPTDKKLRNIYARLLLEQKDWLAAQQQFTQLYKDDPKDGDSLFALGILSLQLKQRDQSIKYLEHLYNLGSHQDDAAYYLGQIQEEDGHNTEAVTWYTKVNGDNRLNAQIRIAQIYAKQGNTFKAREIIQQIRDQVNVKDQQMDLVEAEILREAKQYKLALEVLTNALNKNPDNSELLYTRALTAIQMGQFDASEQDFKLIIKLDPKNVEALNALGYTLATETTRYKEALEYIQRALELKPDNPAILDSMGWVQYRLGNKEKALTFLKRALEMMPDPEIASHLGEVLWENGDQAKARQIWSEALQKTPNSEYILKMQKRYGVQF